MVKLPRWPRSPFRGEAALSWCAAKREWYAGFKLVLAVTPAGVITSAALLPANWPGHAAAAYFDEHATRLMPAASRFVDRCLNPSGDPA